MVGVELARGLDWLRDDAPAGDPVYERAAEMHERKVFNAWAWLMQQEQGRLIAWWLIDRCHVLGSRYTGNAAQAFLEGERNVGLTILKEFLLPNEAGALGVLMAEAEDRFDHLMAVAAAQIRAEAQDDRADND